MDLTDKQWDLLKIHIPKEELSTEPRRGRAWFDSRKALNGILWILKTGAQWKYLPAEFGNFKTIHNRFQRWVRLGVIDSIVQDLATKIFLNSKIDTSTSFIDATFSPAKKGGIKLGKLSGGREQKSWALSIVMGYRWLLKSNPQLPTKLSLPKKRSKSFLSTSKLAS